MKLRYPFERVSMDRKYAEFMPYLDPDTVYLHYENIYQDAVSMLNYLIGSYPKLQDWTLEELITNDMEQMPLIVIRKIKFYAGSVYNHSLYFDNMCKQTIKNPIGKLEKAINARYGNQQNFKNVFKDAAQNVMGVGFVWLNSERNGNIHISITTDYNTPSLRYITPIIALDVWEHSYYLKYPTALDQYIDGWFEIVDWEKISNRFEKSLSDAKHKNHFQVEEYSLIY